ncbi:hypothetical protein ACLB1O_09130 [Escherichia coli]
MSKNERMVGISRRTLVKSTAIGSLALAAGGFSLPFTLRNAAASVQQARERSGAPVPSTMVAAVHFVYMLKIMK